MKTETLFGHLASKFSSHPENLATESLLYVIKRSAVAKDSFVRFICEARTELNKNLRFDTQVRGNENTIPDLVGIDENGDRILLVETKFWAGLTDNQPVNYIESLPPNKNGILLFVAPALRLNSLWMELLRRCRDNKVEIQKEDEISDALKVCSIVPNRTLAITSWRLLTATIHRDLQAAGHLNVLSDLQQLEGLCEHMDTNAFLPLNSEELAPQLGRRIQDFCQLVDEITDQLREDNLCSTKGLRASAGSGYYGRYMKIDSYGCFLQFNAELWCEQHETPLWLSIHDSEWGYPDNGKERLRSLLLESPPRLVEDKDGLYIPLFVLIGVEKNRVLESLVAQIKEIADYLKSVNPRLKAENDE